LIGVLDDQAVARLGVDEVNAITPTQISNLTTSQFDALTTVQLDAFGPDQVGVMSSAQATALGSYIGALNNIGSLNNSVLAELKPEQVLGLTTWQIGGLTTSQFGALTFDQVAVLSSAQVAVIDVNQAVALGDDIAAIDPITSLADQSVAALTSAEVRIMTTTQINALLTGQFDALTTGQVAAFNSPQVGAIGTAGVVALGVYVAEIAEIGSLGTASVAVLSETQIVAITPTQIALLQSGQVAAMTTDQLDVLSTAQIVALDSVENAGALSALQTAALHANFGFAIVSSELEALTPVALDLNGDGVRTLSSIAGAVFDVNADGRAESVGWLANSDAWLALDHNQNGLIDDGAELFGSGTTMPDGSKAIDGFAALRVLDSNHDGVVDSRDDSFASLSVWVDANSNAKTDEGELKALSQVSVSSISVDSKPTALIDQGNLIGLMGNYTTVDGQTHEMADVWLAANPLGARIVDLSRLDHSPANAGSLSRITLSGNGAGDTLKLSLSDVLSFGDNSVVSGIDGGDHSAGKQMLVSGEANDSVHLSDAANWTMSGTAIIGDASYRVLTQGMAQLLIEDKVKIVTV